MCSLRSSTITLTLSIPLLLHHSLVQSQKLDVHSDSVDAAVVIPLSPVLLQKLKVPSDVVDPVVMPLSPVQRAFCVWLYHSDCACYSVRPIPQLFRTPVPLMPLSIPLPPPTTVCFPLFRCFERLPKSFTLSPPAQDLFQTLPPSP